MPKDGRGITQAPIDLSTLSNVRQLPPRKPRYTAQDHEDFDDVRRLVFMRQALHHLMGMHTNLHEIFGEVIRTDEAWPFYSVRHMQNYVDPDKFTMLTRSPQLLEAARVTTQMQVEKDMTGLSKALLADTGLTLATISGLELRADSHLLKRSEEELERIRDVIDQASPEEKHVLGKVARVTQHSLRTMFHMGSPLSDMGQKAIAALVPDTRPSTYEHDPSYLPDRRKHLRLAEQWMHVTVGEMTMMKLDLLADYVDPFRSENRQEDMFEGSLVEVTPPQRSFIHADAQSTRTLEQAGRAVQLALSS